jgi:hypothetical protein
VLAIDNYADDPESGLISEAEDLLGEFGGALLEDLKRFAPSDFSWATL